MTDAVQPGWYPAPGEPGFEREWDGATWTDQRRALAPAGQGSVASLVLGILGVLTSWVLIGILLGIIALVLGGRNDPKAPISRAGRILGAVAIALGILLAVLRGIAAVNNPY